MTVGEFYRKARLYKPTVLIGYIWVELRHKFYYRPMKHSYSQHQEDLYIDTLLGNKQDGTYVDVGANDPNRFSNTKRFYDRGWRGINIEPDISNYQKLVEQRPEDTNLHMGIAAKEGKLDFYKMFPDTVSTFSKEEADATIARGLKLDKVIKVPVMPLKDVLKAHDMDQIDFLSVDTEGLDFIVLQSNDWKKYRPAVICVESIPRGEQSGTSEQHTFLEGKGYKRVFHNRTNDIYVDGKS